MIDVDEYYAKWNHAREIVDPAERAAAQRRVIEEMTGASRAEARDEMEVLDAAWAKHFGHFKGSLYMVLDDGLTFSRLHGCQVVHFSGDWTETQINDALVEEAGNDEAHSNVVYWFEN